MCFLPQRYNFSAYPPNNLALSHKKLLQSEGGGRPAGLYSPDTNKRKQKKRKAQVQIFVLSVEHYKTRHAKFANMARQVGQRGTSS